MNRARAGLVPEISEWNYVKWGRTCITLTWKANCGGTSPHDTHRHAREHMFYVNDLRGSFFFLLPDLERGTLLLLTGVPFPFCLEILGLFFGT